MVNQYIKNRNNILNNTTRNIKQYPSLTTQEFKEFQEFCLKHPFLWDDFAKEFQGKPFTYRDAFELEKALREEKITLRRFLP